MSKSNNFQFIKAKPLNMGLAFLIAASIFNSNVYANTFSDITASQAKQYIETFSQKGFLSGYPDGTFRPNNPITRAEVVALFAKFDVKVNTNGVDFKDISINDWFKESVEKATKTKILSGYDDGTFKPLNDITRYEAIKLVSLMVRSENYQSVQLPYSDSENIPLWVNNDVRNLYSAGVIGIYPSNIINGNEKATRAEVVEMMSKAMEKQSWSIDAVSQIIGENMRNPLPIPTDISSDILGYLSIPSINLKNNPVVDGTSLEIMKDAIGHYTETSNWDGNIAFAAHNTREKYDFKDLKNVNIGDEVIYKTRFGERRYKVTLKKEIAEDDWTYLNKNSDINKVTMTTCVANVGNKRLCVQAEQIN